MIKVDFKNIVKDKRLQLRGAALATSFAIRLNCSIKSLSNSWAEQKGNYAFLNSPKLTEENIIAGLALKCKSYCSNRILLAISDTTDINLTGHTNRLVKNEGYGVLDNNRVGVGFKMHPTVIVDASSFMPIGLSSVQFITRTENGKRTGNESRKAAISEKESKKWPTGVTETEAVIKNAYAVVFVQDREGDIFEQLAAAPGNDNSFLLIRTKANRKTTDNIKLFDRLSKSPVLGIYEDVIEGGGNRKQKTEKAKFEVRVVETQFMKPEKKSKELPDLTQPVYVIEVKQINVTTATPILWRLTTTWPIEDFDSIKMVIGWYQARWLIEEIFRVLKKEVVDIESCELENAYSIRKFILIMMEVILKLFQINAAYNEPECGYDSSLVFDENEQDCLDLINEHIVKGTTKKQCNPYKVKSLKHAVWIIARLGGWMGYATQRKAGMTTFVNGLKQFYLIYKGYKLPPKVGTR